MEQPTMKSFSLGVILCAAGRSERMGGTDKINYPLGGKPVYRWAADAFLAYAHTARLVVAVPPEKLAAFLAQGPDDPRIVYCAGGAARQETVEKAAVLLGQTDLIAVHDGARPFIGVELIDAVCAAIRRGDSGVARDGYDSYRRKRFCGLDARPENAVRRADAAGVFAAGV